MVMDFQRDLEALRMQGSIHGSMVESEADWAAFAEQLRGVAAQVPGVDAGAIVEAVRVELPRTCSEPAMPLDRVAVGVICEAAMESPSPAARPYEDAASAVYLAVKRSLSPQG
jgi:hypothetical protein